MQRFVRGNKIVCSGTFTPVSGTAQPTTVSAVLTFKDATTGAATSSTVALTADAENVWTGVWDSLLAQEGEVEWRIQGKGALQAAQQGKFLLQANDANVEALDP
jgi:hypothetical protein